MVFMTLFESGGFPTWTSCAGGPFLFHYSGRVTYFPCSIVFQALSFLPKGLIAFCDALQVFKVC